MSDSEMVHLEDCFQSGDEIIFTDDFFQGNVVHVEEDVAVIMDFRDEIEREIFLTDYSISHFEIIE